MEFLGKATINPAVFYSGKISGYIAWSIQLLFMLGADLYGRVSNVYTESLSVVFLVLGLAVVVLSLVHLGSSTRFGLPMEETVFKTNGLYRISRNPMYVGFNLLTLSSVFYTLDIWVALLGIYSSVVYHMIILGEEKFLCARFGDAYSAYMKRVRRYL